MKRKRTAYILLPTITVIMLLSTFYLVQGKVFVNRLQTERLQITSEEVDCTQIYASKLYLSEGQRKGNFKEFSYEIDENQREMTISDQKGAYHRFLLGKKPDK